VTGPAGSGTAPVRLRWLLACQARLQWRYGVVALVAAVTLIWTALLAVLPLAVARVAAPWVLFLDTAVLGTTLVGAIVILERDQGMRAAFAVSPARVAERLTVTVGPLAGLVVAAAAPIALAARPVSPGGLVASLLGVFLVALLTMLLAVAVAAQRQSVITFMIALPLVLFPLVAPALVHAAGLGHPVLYAVPTVGAMDLVAAGYGVPAGGLGWSAAWLVLACAAAAWLAARQLGPVRAARAAPAVDAAQSRIVTLPAPVDRNRPVPRRYRRRSAAAAFLRSDLAVMRRDPLLVMIGLSPLLLGLSLRLGYPPVHQWLITAYAVDLDPYRPLLLGLAVVLHVPVVFGMIGALLVLDDADSRALTALRVSPLTLHRYLGYRAALVTVAAAIGLATSVPLSALAPAGAAGTLIAACVPAALLAPLVMIVAVAVADDRVQGVAVLKALGLPVYLPVAGWWLNGAAAWLLAPLPTWWVLRSVWEQPGPAYAAGGVALIAAATALLAPVAVRRLRRHP
jgi:hypothetical protein